MSSRKHLLAARLEFCGPQCGHARHRRGAATLDYILVLCFILPVSAFVIGMGGKIMQLVYEMLAVFLAWPFM